MSAHRPAALRLIPAAMLIVVIGLGVAAPAVAQDAPLIDFNGALDHSRVTGRMVRQAQGREAGTSAARRATPAQAAACPDKQKFRRQYGATDAKVRKLYGLCRGVGL